MFHMLETQITKKNEQNKTRNHKNIKTKLNDLNNASEEQYKAQLVWTNIIVFIVLHLSAFHGLYLIFFEKKFWLYFYTLGFGIIQSQGITAGAHRLWSHRSYKVKFPLKLLLVFLQTASFQNSIFVWTRDHRLHHKYTDTNADPHNAQRGFFFSHMGWLFVRKHPDVINKGRSIDMSDITCDPLLMLQHKYYYQLMIVCAFILPVYMLHFLTGEKLSHCVAIGGSFRYIYSVHMTWLVNSAAHIFGTKPYDRNIGPTENIIVSHLTCGEGFHNYHHVFPWDYKAAELGNYTFNFTLFAINSFAKIGWAYDMKTVSKELIKQRILRTGDRKLLKNTNFDKETILHEGNHDDELVWGWNDPNLPQEHKELADISNKSQK